MSNICRDVTELHAPLSIALATAEAKILHAVLRAFSSRTRTRSDIPQSRSRTPTKARNIDKLPSSSATPASVSAAREETSGFSPLTAMAVSARNIFATNSTMASLSTSFDNLWSRNNVPNSSHAVSASFSRFCFAAAFRSSERSMPSGLSHDTPLFNRLKLPRRDSLVDPPRAGSFATSSGKNRSSRSPYFKPSECDARKFHHVVSRRSASSIASIVALSQCDSANDRTLCPLLFTIFTFAPRCSRYSTTSSRHRVVA
mmetsp:Transcript_7403/g.29762  ORF Transcript_7403/g.29762 Transcript_7403/m.29762 type:complete len:258 (+) Transcript_7403:1654-2427(+)